MTSSWWIAFCGIECGGVVIARSCRCAVLGAISDALWIDVLHCLEEATSGAAG